MSYILNIFKTGAVSKTPKSVINKIVQKINNNQINNILEFGAGKGEITEAVINSLYNITTYDAFELDPNATTYLKNNFKNVNIINADALMFKNKVEKQYDLIICSLPLSFFEKDEREEFYKNIKNHLAINGTVIILFTAFWLKTQLKENFKNAELKKASNVPPYYILTYKNTHA